MEESEPLNKALLRENALYAGKRATSLREYGKQHSVVVPYTPKDDFKKDHIIE